MARLKISKVNRLSGFQSISCIHLSWPMTLVKSHRAIGKPSCDVTLQIYQGRHTKAFPWIISSATQACHRTLASQPQRKSLRKSPATPATFSSSTLGFPEWLLLQMVIAHFTNPSKKSKTPNTCAGFPTSSLLVGLSWEMFPCGTALSLTKRVRKQSETKIMGNSYLSTEALKRWCFQFQGFVLSFGIFLCLLNMVGRNTYHKHNHLFALIDLIRFFKIN